MKSFTLLLHQKGFSGKENATIADKCILLQKHLSLEEDLLINMKGLPEAREGDIVEIYHPNPDEQNPRLLLQIKFKEDLQISNNLYSNNRTNNFTYKSPSRYNKCGTKYCTSVWLKNLQCCMHESG